MHHKTRHHPYIECRKTTDDSSAFLLLAHVQSTVHISKDGNYKAFPSIIIS